MPRFTKIGVVRQCTMLMQKNHPAAEIRVYERFAQMRGWETVERHCSTMATMAEYAQNN